MRKSIILAAAVSLCMAPAAFAQSAATTAETTASVAPKWDAPIIGAFFTDSEGTMMRPEAEVKTNFSQLTPEQQVQVKTDCETMMRGSATSGDTASTGSGSGGGQNGASTSREHLCGIVMKM